MKRKTIQMLHKALAAGELTSEALTKQYLDAIKASDEQIGAFLHVDEVGALESAAAIDAQRKKGQVLGPLAGIPMALKDNMCTLKMPTTCGSRILEGYVSPFEADVVTRLKKAGAVILGKLNLDEFAMGGSTEHSYYKKTCNPADVNRVPGGSSGGSAAAVAAGEAVYALGSDTGGSIRQPASFCGVAGLKPTYGRISRRGLVAFASSLDQIGPLANSVEDLAYILPEISGYDPLDSTSANRPADTTKALLGRDVSKMRIAMPREFFGEGLQPDVRRAVLSAAARYEAMGAVVEEVDMPILKHALPAYYLISSAEASSNLARFDGVQYGYRTPDFESLTDLYKKSRGEGFGREVKRRILLGTYALSSGYYDAYYQKALKVRTLIQNEFKRIYERYDAVLSPVAPTTAYKFGAHSQNPVEMYLEDIYTVPVNIAGLPGLSVHCGTDAEGLPIGMQLIGKAFDEATLLSLGYAFEQAVTKGGITDGDQ